MHVLRGLHAALRHRTVLMLLALLSAFGGADLLLNRPKGSALQWLAVPLLATGGALFVWAIRLKGVTPAASQSSLAGRFVRLLTLRGRLIPYFPILGVAIVIADLAYNMFLSATPALLTEDTIVVAAAGALIGYSFVPIRFARERDFVLVFFIMLNAILVVPLLATRAFSADFQRSVDVYSWIALAPQTSAVLNLIGVSNAVHPVVGSTAPGLTFTPRNLQIQVTVVITTACSGIYSFGIFASAFIAFVLTEYDHLSKRIWVLLGLGFLASYAANVLRMVVIVLVGYYTDTSVTDLQNMLIAHSYAGWIIFLAWVSLFWGVLLKFLPLQSEGPKGAPAVQAFRRGALCGICHGPLTPSIAATRCVCGVYHHEGCLASLGSCPACGTQTRTKDLFSLG